MSTGSGLKLVWGSCGGCGCQPEVVWGGCGGVGDNWKWSGVGVGVFWENCLDIKSVQNWFAIIFDVKTLFTRKLFGHQKCLKSSSRSFLMSRHFSPENGLDIKSVPNQFPIIFDVRTVFPLKLLGHQKC